MIFLGKLHYLFVLICVPIECFLRYLRLVLWKGKREYEAKRTAHWCVEACDYSYLTALTGGGDVLSDV